MNSQTEEPFSVTEQNLSTEQVQLPGNQTVANELQKNDFWKEESKVEPNLDGTHTAKAIELSIWLHTEYQSELEEADAFNEKVPEDETKPF